MRNNQVLAERFRANMAAYGIDDMGDDPNAGSTDMANVSWVCPTIHPDLAICDEGVPGHSILFRDAAATPRADETTLLAATLVAQTAVELFTRPGARRGGLGGVPRRLIRPTAGAAARCYHRARRAPLDARSRTGGAPSETDSLTRPRPLARARLRRNHVAERPHDPDADPDFAAANGWDRQFETFSDFDLPTYVGPTTFMNLPWITDPDELRRREVDVAIIGAPFDDAVSHRPGARFGPRAIREAQYTSGSINSLQLDVEPFEVLTVVDAGDANIVPAWIERGHAMIYRKVREVAATGAIPIVLGGDHSITWPARPPIAEVRRPGSIGIVHFDAHADTANDDWGVLAGHGTPMRRLIESGAVKGTQLRPGRPARLLAAGRDVRVDAGAGPALPLHARDRGARRGGRHRPGHRGGARRPRLHLPEPRHRRHRPGHGARAPARPSPAACSRARCCAPSARSSARSTSPGWTSSRCRRRTTTPRRPRWPPTGPRSRRSAPSPCAAATARRVRWDPPAERRPASIG